MHAFRLKKIFPVLLAGVFLAGSVCVFAPNALALGGTNGMMDRMELRLNQMEETGEISREESKEMKQKIKELREETNSRYNSNPGSMSTSGDSDLYDKIDKINKPIFERYENSKAKNKFPADAMGPAERDKLLENYRKRDAILEAQEKVEEERKEAEEKAKKKAEEDKKAAEKKKAADPKTPGPATPAQKTPETGGAQQPASTSTAPKTSTPGPVTVPQKTPRTQTTGGQFNSPDDLLNQFYGR